MFPLTRFTQVFMFYVNNISLSLYMKNVSTSKGIGCCRLPSSTYIICKPVCTVCMHVYVNLFRILHVTFISWPLNHIEKKGRVTTSCGELSSYDLIFDHGRRCNYNYVIALRKGSGDTLRPVIYFTSTTAKNVCIYFLQPKICRLLEFST